MSYASGGGAHAQSQGMVDHSIVGQITAAQNAARLRFRLTFVAVWIAIIVGIGVALAAANAWDWEFALESGPVIVLQGAGITVLISVASIVGATILAILGALGRISTNPILYAIASFYVSLIRGTPLIAQIYIIYFALPQLDIVIPAIPAGILALSLNYGAYMTEIFRAGIQAVPRGQREAAGALGMRQAHIMRRIVLPQAVRIVTPAIGNEFIAMLKDSALLSTISVHETLFLAQRLGRSSFEPITALLIAAIVYWILTIVFSIFQERLEKRMARSDR
ncbi:MAG TPA: amino acid ABC transporter permease [Gemmatimonadota bacterium]|jgi:polar amino acid transport system permease protein|nr:amino acid ABC transporter permease [Gemmatimonadota bacterium]